MNDVSADEPDWSREAPVGFWDPGRKLLKAVRDFQRLRTGGGPLAGMRRLLVKARHRFWSVAAGAEIPVHCAHIAGGLKIPHPNGVVIHPASVIGPNCLLMQQVTLGVARGGAAPRLGGHVDVGAGAKIIGPVTIGDGAQIGANAVVVKDVPAGAIAVGVPARILGRAEERPPGSEAQTGFPSH